jgi:hypothetical protein
VGVAREVRVKTMQEGKEEAAMVVSQQEGE